MKPFYIFEKNENWKDYDENNSTKTCCIDCGNDIKEELLEQGWCDQDDEEDEDEEEEEEDEEQESWEQIIIDEFRKLEYRLDDTMIKKIKWHNDKLKDKFNCIKINKTGKGFALKYLDDESDKIIKSLLFKK